MCASASVSVSLHAAGAAPAAPAPSAGPHAPRRAAGVRARLAHSAAAAAAPLRGALSSDTSGIHTCCTPVRPVRQSRRVACEAAELRPTVLFEAALCARSGLWRLCFGAAAAVVTVAGPTVVALPRFPFGVFLPLWNHYNIVLGSTSTMTFLN